MSNSKKYERITHLRGHHSHFPKYFSHRITLHDTFATTERTCAIQNHRSPLIPRQTADHRQARLLEIYRAKSGGGIARNTQAMTIDC